MTRFVIDTNSLINLFRYYDQIRNFEKITELITKYIESGKIIILDKVYGELSNFLGKGNIIDKLGLEERHCTKTDDVLPDLMRKSEEWYKKENEKQPKYTHNPELIDIDRQEFYDTSADLFLVMKCVELDDAILITEETPNEKYDNKLFPKIPLICFKERIRFDTITDLLFKYLKDELTIKVE